MGDDDDERGPPPAEFPSIGIQELLDADARPSFVVDLKAHPPHIAYRNAALTTGYDIGDIIWEDLQYEREQFKQWARSSENVPTFRFCNISWTAAILRERWKIINGNPPSIDQPSANSVQKGRAVEQPVAEHVDAKVTRSKMHDWTWLKPPSTISSHTKLLREWDWASTPLGPIESWPPILRSMANLVNIDPNPAVIFWGSKMAHLYNEPYIGMLNQKHPQALGQPYLQTWAELYANPETAELLDQLWTQGRVHRKATLMLHQAFFLLNGGQLEERFFNITILPIIGESGETVGFYEPFTEITSDHINERRSGTVRRIGEVTTGQEDPAGFFQKLLMALNENDRDVPFAIMYSITHDRSQSSPKEFSLEDGLKADTVRLESYLGVALDQDDTPVASNLLFRDETFRDAFEAVVQNGEPAFVDLESWPALQRVLMVAALAINP